MNGANLLRLPIIVMLSLLISQCENMSRPKAFTARKSAAEQKSDDATPLSELEETDSQGQFNENVSAPSALGESDDSYIPQRKTSRGSYAGWGDAIRLYESQSTLAEIEDFKVISNNHGQSIYGARIGKSDSSNQSYIIASYSSDGQTWNQEQRIDQDTSLTSADAQARRFALALADDGTALLAWSQDHNQHSAIFGALFNPETKTWSQPFVLAEKGGYHFALAFDEPSKRFIYVYSQEIHSNQVAMYANEVNPASDKESVDLSAAFLLDSDDSTRYVAPKILVRGGVGCVVYKKINLQPSTPVIYQLKRATWSENHWYTPELVTQEGSHGLVDQMDGDFKNTTADDISLAINAKNEVAIVWDIAKKETPTSSDLSHEIWVAMYNAKHERFIHQRLSRGGRNSIKPKIAFNNANQGLVVWQRQSPQASNLEYSYYDPNERSFSVSSSLDGLFDHRQYDPDLKAAVDGEFVMVFVDDQDGVNRAKSSIFANANRRWQDVQTISDPKLTLNSSLPAIFFASTSPYGVIWRQTLKKDQDQILPDLLAAPYNQPTR